MPSKILGILKRKCKKLHTQKQLVIFLHCRLFGAADDLQHTVRGGEAEQTTTAPTPLFKKRGPVLNPRFRHLFIGVYYYLQYRYRTKTAYIDQQRLFAVHR